MEKYLLLFFTNPNTIMADQYYKLRFFCTSLTFLCLLTLVSDFRQLYKFIFFFISYLKTIILEQIHRKIKGTVQKFPIYILHSSYIASLVINVCDKSGTFVTTNEFTLTHHHHPKSIVNIWVHSWCCTFYMCGQIHHYKCSLPVDSFFLFLFFLLNVDVSSSTPIFWKDYLCSIVLLLLLCWIWIAYMCECLFWDSCLLMYLFLLSSLPYCFNCCSFMANLEVVNISPTFFFSFSNYVDYSGSFAWYKFCSVCQYPQSNVLEFLLWSYLIYK